MNVPFPIIINIISQKKIFILQTPQVPHPIPSGIPQSHKIKLQNRERVIYNVESLPKKISQKQTCASTTIFEEGIYFSEDENKLTLELPKNIDPDDHRKVIR
ncbi:6499_t:CDS:2 [Funneliformis mosseae]|uniref:6499_t:CDS:1 n=1 Tax=Funneliformis mosseae TaxID=27381 RepID=A0A9N8ZRA8_FUNMO|nr:6499_t:CDS:2 [Funneliformis mosseae]